MLLNVPLLECKVVGPRRTVTAKFWSFLTKFICVLVMPAFAWNLTLFKAAKQWKCNSIFFFNLRDSICGIKCMGRECINLRHCWFPDYFFVPLQHCLQPTSVPPWLTCCLWWVNRAKDMPHTLPHVLSAPQAPLPRTLPQSISLVSNHLHCGSSIVGC